MSSIDKSRSNFLRDYESYSKSQNASLLITVISSVALGIMIGMIKADPEFYKENFKMCRILVGSLSGIAGLGLVSTLFFHYKLHVLVTERALEREQQEQVPHSPPTPIDSPKEDPPSAIAMRLAHDMMVEINADLEMQVTLQKIINGEQLNFEMIEELLKAIAKSPQHQEINNSIAELRAVLGIPKKATEQGAGAERVDEEQEVAAERIDVGQEAGAERVNVEQEEVAAAENVNPIVSEGVVIKLDFFTLYLKALPIIFKLLEQKLSKDREEIVPFTPEKITQHVNAKVAKQILSPIKNSQSENSMTLMEIMTEYTNAKKVGIQKYIEQKINDFFIKEEAEGGLLHPFVEDPYIKAYLAQIKSIIIRMSTAYYDAILNGRNSFDTASHVYGIYSCIKQQKKAVKNELRKLAFGIQAHPVTLPQLLFQFTTLLTNQVQNLTVALRALRA